MSVDGACQPLYLFVWGEEREDILEQHLRHGAADHGDRVGRGRDLDGRDLGQREGVGPLQVGAGTQAIVTLDYRVDILTRLGAADDGDSDKPMVPGETVSG